MKINRLLIIIFVLILTFTPATAEAVNINSFETSFNINISDADIDKIAKTLYGECRSDKIPTIEKSAVVWCILNRCDLWQLNIDEVITKNQFHGYNKNNPVTDELKKLTIDVVGRWIAEKAGISEDVGRTLPKEYIYFAGRNGRNYFRDAYINGNYWDWDCKNPYIKDDDN